MWLSAEKELQEVAGVAENFPLELNKRESSLSLFKFEPNIKFNKD